MPKNDNNKPANPVEILHAAELTFVAVQHQSHRGGDHGQQHRHDQHNYHLTPRLSSGLITVSGPGRFHDDAIHAGCDKACVCSWKRSESRRGCTHLRRMEFGRLRTCSSVTSPRGCRRLARGPLARSLHRDRGFAPGIRQRSERQLQRRGRDR